MNKKAIEDFEKAVQPIKEWLFKNGHPHMIVVVDFGGAQAFSGEIGMPFEIPDDDSNIERVEFDFEEIKKGSN